MKIETMEKLINDIICWWSGGVTSAVACKTAIDLYGLERCRFIMIDTNNEDEDTYRFKSDCEKWYKKKIESIGCVGEGKKYETMEDVWYDFLSLDNATGAICSSESKRQVRLDFQKRNEYTYQVFGFDTSSKKEIWRSVGLKNNYPTAKPIFPNLLYGYTKKNCISILEEANIEIPIAYKLGFSNNNCLKTLCVQGGIGYWQLAEQIKIKEFNKMAQVEHNITDLKGKPVTVCKDQSNEAKISGRFQVFLKPHPDYPNYKSLSDMKGREPEMLIECNGFCGMKEEGLFNKS